MRNLLFSSLVILSLQSCITFHPPSDIKNHFTYCYDGKPTGLDSLINIEGFYKIGQLSDQYGRNGIKEHIIDTTYMNFMFYRDGTFVYSFFGYSGTTDDYLKKVVVGKKEKELFENNFYWGRYIVDHGTIKAQWINHAPILGTWYGFEDWYKIVDKNTLRYIKSEPLDSRTEIEYRNFKDAISKIKYLDAKFVPTEVRPDSNTWLKQEKWFLCK